MRSRELSASSIKTYLQCLLKYYFHYEDKKPREGKTNPLAFGIAVHEALEELYNIVSETKEAPSPEVYKRVLEVYMRSAAENGLTDMEVLQEGRDTVISRMDHIDPEEKVLGRELEFHLKTPSGTPFTGSIDRLIELDEETVVVIDYKTSRMALNQDEADTDIQMSMYDYAVSVLYPQYKTIILALDYTRLGEVVTHRTPEQRRLFVEFLDAIYYNICNTPGDKVQPNLNSLCGYCAYKNWCPDYKKVIEDPTAIIPRLDGLNDEEFIRAWEVADASRKIVDLRYRELKDEAYHRMKQTKTIKGGKSEIYRTQSSRVSYDARPIFNIVGQDNFVKMASVSKTAVDKFLTNNPDLKDEVDSAANFSFNSPSFRIRKIKESGEIVEEDL